MATVPRVADADATIMEFYDKFAPIGFEPGAWTLFKSGE